MNMLKDEMYRNQCHITIKNRFNALYTEEAEQYPSEAVHAKESIDRKWKIIKESLQTTAEEVLPKKTKKNNNEWITDEILHKMEQRKKHKNKNPSEYKIIDREIAQNCREAKEKWLQKQCQDIEALEKQHKSKEMYNKIKDLTNNKRNTTQTSCIRDKNGQLLFDQQEIAKRWVEYISNLYDDNRNEIPEFEVTTGENILKEEVEKAIKTMKDGKATGIDEITTEGLKALDEENADALTRFCNSIYNSGHIPTEMEQSIFIPLPKKPKAQNCTEYRTISLMSHVTKLVLKVIQQRITTKINEEVSQLQNGFRLGLGTRDGIFNLRMIIERALEIQQDVYICFIDYTKAFDRVKHSKMIECL